MNEEFKPRISKTIMWLMLSVALFYDVQQALFNLIPYLGQVLSYLILLFSTLHFFIWFKIHDVGFLERFGAKKILAYIAVPVLEVLSLGIAPGITIATLITILIVKAEDKLIKMGLITRDDLRKIEKIVIKTGKIHGFDSPEFKKSMSDSLKKEVERRYPNQAAQGVIAGSVNKQVITGSSEEKKNSSGQDSSNSHHEELNNLKKDIKRVETELQQLESKKRKEEELLRGHDSLAERMIEEARDGGDEKRAQELYHTHQQGRAVSADKVNSLYRDIKQKKNYIFILNGKLSKLERSKNRVGNKARAA